MTAAIVSLFVLLSGLAAIRFFGKRENVIMIDLDEHEKEIS